MSQLKLFFKFAKNKQMKLRSQTVLRPELFVLLLFFKYFWAKNGTENI